MSHITVCGMLKMKWCTIKTNWLLCSLVVVLVTLEYFCCNSVQKLHDLSFTEQPGPARIVKQWKTSLDFMFFFTTTIWLELVKQMNLYYAQSIASKPSTMPRQDVTVEELQAFTWIIIAMGVIHLPEVDDYWSTVSIIQHPWLSALMSRTRFRQILCYFHVADNSLPKTDYKPQKVRPVVDNLNVSFSQMYTPSQCLSVDESMVGTKCRISLL